MFNHATGAPQLVFGSPRVATVGKFDQSGKVWSSISHAAIRTEEKLEQPASTGLRNASTLSDAIDELESLGLDIVLTSSATEDAVALDEDWYTVGAAKEVGEVLRRYLESANATFSVTKKGAVRVISRDEMSDLVHFQTIIYKVNHLAADWRELCRLADHIQATCARDDWETGGGSAVIQPRIQSGQRLMIVSIHYQNHVKLRQLLYELNVATCPESLLRF